MSQRKVRTYDKEFKLNAIKLYLESGRGYKKISEELGIPTGTLVGWVEDHKKEGEHAFPGKGHIKPADTEMTLLRKELGIVREESNCVPSQGFLAEE